MAEFNKIELAENNLKRVNYWISNSDSKIGIILAFQAGITAFLTTKGIEIKKIITTQAFDALHFILYLILILFLFFLIKSIFHAFKSLYPNISNREQSLLFFGNIASMGINKFKREFSSLTQENAIEELNNQTFTNSQIAVAKFKNVQESIKSFLFGFISWFIVLGLITCLA